MALSLHGYNIPTSIQQASNPYHNLQASTFPRLSLVYLSNVLQHVKLVEMDTREVSDAQLSSDNRPHQDNIQTTIFPFLDIPRKLRNQIYKLTVISNGIIVYGPSSLPSYASSQPSRRSLSNYDESLCLSSIRITSSAFRVRRVRLFCSSRYQYQRAVSVSDSTRHFSR
jgi:hypothetical protein